MTKSIVQFEYENLVNLFERSLLTELRGHGSSGEFIRLWVPDADIVKSLTNMADAAELEGVASFEVNVSSESISPTQIDNLKNIIVSLFNIESVNMGQNRVTLRFNHLN